MRLFGVIRIGVYTRVHACASVCVNGCEYRENVTIADSVVVLSAIVRIGFGRGGWGLVDWVRVC